MSEHDARRHPTELELLATDRKTQAAKVGTRRWRGAAFTRTLYRLLALKPAVSWPERKAVAVIKPSSLHLPP